MEIATWREMTFRVSAREIASFDAIAYGVEIETEDATASGQTYAKMKSVKARSLSVPMTLLAAAGADVEGEIGKWIAMCDGQGAKFYVGGRALMGCDFLLTKVNVSEAQYDARGTCVSASLALEFTQAKGDLQTGYTGTATNAGTSASKTNTKSLSILEKDMLYAYDKASKMTFQQKLQAIRDNAKQISKRNGMLFK